MEPGQVSFSKSPSRGLKHAYLDSILSLARTNVSLCHARSKARDQEQLLGRLARDPGARIRAFPLGTTYATGQYLVSRLSGAGRFLRSGLRYARMGARSPRP
jgi:hypothetical protein